jgi:hypothetical protein
MVMRVAGAELLPHEFTNLQETTKGYVTQLKTLRDNVAKRIEDVNRQLADGYYACQTIRSVRCSRRRPRTPRRL